LIPVVGYLILLNAKVVQYLSVVGDLAISWRLIALYVGLSFVALATAVYGLYAPETIKRYRTAVEFVGNELDYFSRGNNAQYVRDSAQAEYAALAQWKIDAAPGLQDPDIIRPDAEIATLMTARWLMRDMKAVPARVTTLLCYATGFGIVALPSVATFADVLQVIARELLGYIDSVWSVTSSMTPAST
jgi:hypothetical protein